MDRRQRKTRAAILSAFSQLLSKKHYAQISVQEIIDAADVGRTTFYAHFETKDYLLKALCEELFGHIIAEALGQPHKHCDFCCSGSGDSVFLHLLRHLQENDYLVLDLLRGENNAVFLRYFKENLRHLIIAQYVDTGAIKNCRLPQDYIIDHISSSFVETVYWWLSRGCKETPETVTEYFLAVTEPLF